MTPAETAALLKANPVFAALPPGEIDALAPASRHRRVQAREIVFVEGDAAHFLYVVRSGRVKILKHSYRGRDVLLEVLGPGEIFGCLAVLEQRPYPATAQALEAAEVVGVPGDLLLALSKRHPSVARGIALVAGRRLRAAHESVKTLALEPVEARLAAVLLRLAAREGYPATASVEIPYHVTRQSLGEMAGTTVESTIRVVSRWIEAGLVTDAAGRLVLRDPETLRKLARGEHPCSRVCSVRDLRSRADAPTPPPQASSR